jgi:hypothetical protein
MRQELVDMMAEGWEVFVVDKGSLDEGKLRIMFMHDNHNKQPVEGWKVEMFDIFDGRRRAVLSLDLDDEYDPSEYLQLNRISARRQSAERQSSYGRSEFNKRLAKANIENQIKRDIIQGVTELGVKLPFVPKIEK